MDNPHRIDEDENIIREAVKAELQSMEVSPPLEAWGKIASRLEFNEPVPINLNEKNPVPWYRSLGFAASLLLLMGIGSSLWLSQLFTPYTQNNVSPGSLDMLLDLGGVEEYGEESFDISTETYSFDEVERSVDGSDYAPDILGEFKLRQVTENPGPMHAIYYLYAQEDKELWFVRVGSIEAFTDDFPGADGRFISSDQMANINKEKSVNFLRDDLDKPAVIWFYDDSFYLLWARTDNIRPIEMFELRHQYWQ